MITCIPDSIGNLLKLEKFDLHLNKLELLPESIGNLESLEYLILTGNKLTCLPESIKNIKKLKYLSLMNNNFSEEEKNKIRKILPNVEITW